MQVGQIVKAKRSTAVCDRSEYGVCYEIYSREGFHDGGPEGYSIIFQSGRYDGFSPDEVAPMLTVLHVVDVVCGTYKFKNVMQLSADFRAGRFDTAWRTANLNDAAFPAMFYMLVDGQVEVCDVMRWAAQFQDHDARVVDTDYVQVSSGKRYRVTTLFMGLATAWDGDNRPLVFDTVAFAVEHYGLDTTGMKRWQWPTLPSARDGHAEVVELYRRESRRAI